MFLDTLVYDGSFVPFSLLIHHVIFIIYLFFGYLVVKPMLLNREKKKDR